MPCVHPPRSEAALLAVIPAFNEETRIVAVIRGLLDLHLPVLVVDDGSRDRTALVASAAGAMVVRRPNGGKGAAILTGCNWAVERNYGRVLLLDGDGQHDPREAPVLIRAALAGAELVIGRRCIDVARQPRYRRWFNRLSSLLVTLAAGRLVRDSQSGFRLCDPRLLLSLPLTGRHYDLETEVCILAARSGVRMREVPITVIYTDKISGVHPVFDTLRFLRAVALSLTRCRTGQRLAPLMTCTAPANAPLGEAAQPRPRLATIPPAAFAYPERALSG